MYSYLVRHDTEQYTMSRARHRRRMSTKTCSGRCGLQYTWQWNGSWIAKMQKLLHFVSRGNNPFVEAQCVWPVFEIQSTLLNSKSLVISMSFNPLLHDDPFWRLWNIMYMYLKILWKMEYFLLFWSKCSIFHNIFKSKQNLTYIFLEYFQCCLKIEYDVMI